jgi:hypothetical protein
VGSPAGGAADDVTPTSTTSSGSTSVTFNISRLPHPAENDQSVQGCPGRTGGNRPANVLLAVQARLTVAKAPEVVVPAKQQHAGGYQPDNR